MRKLLLSILGLLGVLSLGVVNASITTVPGLVVTGVQDEHVFTYEVLKFDDGSGHVIMLLDRNLGAIMTGAGAGANTGSYGYHFQWGNNHGFEIGCWTSSCSDIVTENSTGTKVEWNPDYNNSNYSGAIFINHGSEPFDYWKDSIKNNRNHKDLRGGGNDNSSNQWGLSGATEETLKNRQGPCPDGYHVPSVGEWNNLLVRWYNLEKGENLSIMSLQKKSVVGLGNKFAESFMIPLAGYRFYSNAKLDNQGSLTYLWSSSPHSSNSTRARSFDLFPNELDAQDYYRRVYGQSLRCFYNYYLFPYHFSLFSGELELISGNVISGEKLIDIVNFSEFETVRDGYEFGWYLVGANDSFDIISIAITGDISLYAKRTPEEYKIEYELHNGVILWENATGYTIESESITLVNPIKTGYTFKGWSGTKLDLPAMTVIIPSGSTGDRSYEANREINQYTIKYELDGGINNENNVTGYTVETETITLLDPTKEGYNFSGWYLDTEFTNQIAEITQGTTGDITLYAGWTKIETKPSGGSSGGGGRRTNKSDADTQKEDKAPINSSAEPQNDSNIQDSQQVSTKSSEGQNYSEEFQQAYNFAHEKGITTMSSIQDANMNGKLTRIAMAKMLSQYAMNVLGQKPANLVVPKFKDVTDKQNSDYDDGVTLAYQLGIMGQNMPNNKFRPNDEVTRAEFATALSRMLYKTSDGEYKSTPKYYVHHMEKLMNEGIITKNDPAMKELRGYVMIMLMRSSEE